MYSSSGQDHIIKGFLKGSGRQVHGSNSKQRQGVNTDHNDDKESIQDHFKKANDKLCIQHEHCFVLPWIFTVQIDAVKNVLDNCIGYNCQQDSIFKAKD